MTSAKPPRALEELPPYCRFEHFLGDDMVARLLAHVAAHEQAFDATRVGKGEHGALDVTVRASRATRDVGALRPELEERFGNALEPVRQVLGLSPIRLARLELQLVAHGDGAFYTRHIDTMLDAQATDSDRALTGVYYFHRQPRGFSGGALRLLPILSDESAGRYLDIAPDNDSFVLFPSWVPHEVRLVSCPSGEWLDSRFAINCWYRNRR